jgi:hypothetical protein
MKSKAMKTIKTEFDEKVIAIPFPIRIFNFGFKSRQKPSQMQLNMNLATTGIN